MLNEQLKREQIRMCIGVAILCAVMVFVFALFGHFDYTVALGAVLGAALTLANYLLLAFSVEHITKKGEKEAALFMKLSYTLRLILMAVVIIAAIKLPCFNYLAVIIPLLFPQIVIMFIHLKEKRNNE